MILLAYGTRPEYIKIKPLIDIFDKRGFPYKILFTGQHKDLVSKQKVDYRMDIPEKTNNNRLNEIVKITMSKHFSWILEHGVNPSHVLVQGDTTSAFAVALSAFHHKIKIIHLEAGLRTYDKENPYPEEINRRLISQIADIHLCPTLMNVNNLQNEKVSGKIFNVGNTAIDNLLPWREKCEYGGNDILVTLHRRENHHLMKEWFMELNKLAYKYDYLNFIFPMHPNPNVQKNKNYLTAKNIKVIKPVSHEELLDILVKSRLVISDSGGIQEECSFFNKICLNCRKITERPEVVGKSTFMVKLPQELSKIFDKHVNNYIIHAKCPFGDGHSAEKIHNILKELI